MASPRRGLLRRVGNVAGRANRVAGAVAGAIVIPPENIVLLLDFAGDDTATDISDLSASKHDNETFLVNTAVDSDETFLGENCIRNVDGGNLEYPVNDDWDFGTGDFTVEFGVRNTAWSGIDGLIGTYTGGAGDGWWVQWNASGTVLNFGFGADVIKAETWAPSIDTWYHVVITRSGTDLRMFVDGVELGTATTDSSDFSGGTGKLNIGSLTGATQRHLGWIGAVRIIKGTGAYAEGFDPLTVFYDLPEALVDDDFASVSLLLDMEGADGSTVFIDLSDVGNSVLVINEAAVDTAQQRTGSSSLETDGVDDGLKIILDGSPNSHVPFDVQAGDFTVEYHLRADTTAGGDQLFDIGPSGNRSIGILVSNNNVFMEYSVAGSSMTQVDSGHNISDDTWHHIAMVRNGNDLDIYMDGVKGTTTEDVTGLTFHPLDSSAVFFIGIPDDLAGGTDGWIDNLRFTKGIARYTANFTPPNKPYPAPAAAEYETVALGDYSLENSGLITAGTFVLQGIWMPDEGDYLVSSHATGSAGSIRKHAISPAWDLTSLNLTADSSFSVGEPAAGVFLRPDGLKMYVCRYGSDDVAQYTLSPAFDVSSASLDGSKSVAADGSDIPFGLHFSADGTKMYVADPTDRDVYEYTLTTPWDITGTVTFEGIFDTGQSVTGCAISADGLRLLRTRGSGTNSIRQYDMSPSFDITTCSDSGVFINVGTNPESIHLADNDDRIIVVRGSGTVTQYKR